MATPDDIHALEPEDFVQEVHSFEHWFGAVETYLADLEHGHRADLDDPPLPEAECERLVSTLCNYAVAETAALEASSGLIRIAPNHHSRIFLSTQVVDEGRHVEVILQRLRDLGVSDPEAEVPRRAGRGIRNFREKLLALVDAHDWDSAIFAQNVVLEAMEFSVFTAHARSADPVTRDLLERILKDERRHIGFGENEIGRRLREDTTRQRWLSTVRQELDALVLETLETTQAELQIPASERAQLGRDYLGAIGRLGLVP
ncbi:MAG: ferritin-like domain-containing protein [Myxococcota bacterium]